MAAEKARNAAALIAAEAINDILSRTKGGQVQLSKISAAISSAVRDGANRFTGPSKRRDLSDVGGTHFVGRHWNNTAADDV
jgi:hypothetical protein